MKTIPNLIIVLLLLAVLGCIDSGKSTSEPPPSNYDFTGTWSGTLTGASTATNFTLWAIHSDSHITGTLVNDAGFTFDITGTAWADNISLHGVDVMNVSYTIDIAGTCDGLNASGTWYDSVGQSGTWVATKS